ncbi:MAG TPA: VOC family protein [Pseudonocardiaceae bacterium]|nr:VOC family protein [Pseudonocardiaceae bacterium]
MNGKIEVLTLSVRDVEASIAFYTERVGFHLDVDYHPNPGFRVVQLTPAGSGCSIQFGVGLTDAPPGSARAIYLVVTDLEATHRELTERGVGVSEIQRSKNRDNWQGDWEPGIDPNHSDYASMAEFADPDGNTWRIQEIGYTSAD